MLIKQKEFKALLKIVDHHVNGQFDDKRINALYKKISNYLKKPSIEDFKLEQTAIKVIQLGANYEFFVSSLVFKSMPDSCTRKELTQLEDELYRYIEKDLYGKGIDKIFTNKLIEQALIYLPGTSIELTTKKVIGNWGWLIPHALMQVMFESIINMIKMAILDDKRVNRKGRIRIKKM